MNERSDAMRRVLTVRDLIKKLSALPPDLETIHTLVPRVVRDRYSEAVLFEQPLRLCLGTNPRHPRRGSP